MERIKVKAQLKAILKKRYEDSRSDLPGGTGVDIETILSDSDFIRITKQLADGEFRKNLSTEQFIEIYESISSMASSLRSVNERVEVEHFLKDGYKLDFDGLTQSYIDHNLKLKFPDLDIRKLCDLYEKPPTKLQTYYSKTKFIKIDSFVFRKFMLAMIQMVFNQMDILCVYTGSEGSGKSTKASQDMLMLHWFLTEIGVIKYAYKIENMFFNSLASFQDAEDRYFKEPFRILCLDEGNQLNRQEWKSEEVKTFFQRLRRERYNQRIKFICIPVLGEMLTSIVQSRVNFVFDGYMKTDVKTGQLVKGRFKMFVIPRDETIYSPAQKRDLSGDEIRTKLHDNLKDQNYRKGIDPSLVIKRFEANGVWGFKEEDYKEKLKESNAHFSVKKGMTISELDAFMIYKTNITGKRLGLGSKDLRYRAIAKVLSKINVMFEDNPDLYSKYERAYKRKMSRRGDLPADVIEADDDEEESVKEILHEKPEKD